MAVSTARSVWRGAVGARRMRVEAVEYAGQWRTHSPASQGTCPGFVLLQPTKLVN
jgi:hypothetical protein